MPDVGGLTQNKRRLLSTVVNSNLLYATPVWAEWGTKTDKNKSAMRRTQRTVALCTIHAFRTTSADASLLLATIVPANLLAMERTRVRNRAEELGLIANIMNEERAITVNAWQRSRVDIPATAQH